MSDFKAWPKTPRFFRDITVTEKIDGSNAAIQVRRVEEGEKTDPDVTQYVQNTTDGSLWALTAQSRKRIVTPGADNAGFAKWVQKNAETLVQDLGEGIHFGEWWGQGINRNYDLDHKRLSLFNTSKWSQVEFATPNLGVVPVLYEGPMRESEILDALEDLEDAGSYAAPMFYDPEGVCIYHHAANSVFKVLLENDELSKTEAETKTKKKGLKSLLNWGSKHNG